MFAEIMLGIIQGITEWLPVSSSGHLVIFQEFFQTGTPVIFIIMLHVATLFVIFIVFWQEIIKIIRAVFRLDFKSVYGKMFLFIIIGTIPTIIIGLLFKDFFLSLYTNLTAVGIALIINGIILSMTRRMKGRKKLTKFDSLIVGTAQGLAIIPGLSRSGITISTGLIRGVDRKVIASFSFLLAVPAIIGAAILESRNLVIGDINYLSLGISMLVSIIVGYFALKFLFRLVLQKRLYLFSYYCWILGLLIILLKIRA